MTTDRVARACAVLLLVLAGPDLPAANLYYTLSSELAKNHGPGAPHTSFIGVCQGDRDNDCEYGAIYEVVEAPATSRASPWSPGGPSSMERDTTTRATGARSRASPGGASTW